MHRMPNRYPTVVNEGNMTVGRYRAACFDLDGTLADTEPLHLEAERQTLKRFGVEPSPAQPRTFGLGIEPGMALLSETYGLGDPQEVLDVYVPLWERVLEANLKPMPGAKDALKTLDRTSIPMVLVTSGDQEYARLVLDRLDMADFFVSIVTGDQVSEMKPSPEPYLAAADRLGFPTDQVVAFEDSGAGIASAHSAGMFCVAVHAEVRDRPELHTAQLQIASLTEFGPAEVERLFEVGNEHATG